MQVTKTDYHWNDWPLKNFEDLRGHICKAVENISNEYLVFILEDDSAYCLYHEQDCCESVMIDDIVGDLSDLVGYEILMAEEATNNDNPPSDYEESFTWTFYKLATIKGYVTVKWYGSSNGYYSESVDWAKCEVST